jgi:hypothetical protein
MAGVYDLRTIKSLQEKKVNHFAFDFRPRSLNFIQEHLCLKLLKSISFDHIYLQFENEKPYIIERIFKNVRDSFGGEVSVEVFGSLPEIETFHFPFFYNIKYESIPVEVVNHPNLKGYSIDAKFLKLLKDNGSFEGWLNSFYTLNAARSSELVHILSRDWDDDIFPTLYDLLDFDLISLSINSKVELCYRNVDLKKLEQHLTYIRP